VIKIKDLLKSPHIQIALAVGLSIIAMSYFSKHLLQKPIDYLSLAIPPFIATIFESLLAKYKDSKFLKTRYWIVAVFGSTFLIILFYAKT